MIRRIQALVLSLILVSVVSSASALAQNSCLEQVSDRELLGEAALRGLLGNPSPPKPHSVVSVECSGSDLTIRITRADLSVQEESYYVATASSCSSQQSALRDYIDRKRGARPLILPICGGTLNNELVRAGVSDHDQLTRAISSVTTSGRAECFDAQAAALTF